LSTFRERHARGDASQHAPFCAAAVHGKAATVEELQSQADFSIDLIYSGASFAWAGAGESDG
jgi:hypothetical protein